MSDDRAYRSAMNAAVNELGRINDEYIWLSNRKQQLESVVEALKPFAHSGEKTTVEDRRPMYESIESAAESVHADGLNQGNWISDVTPHESADIQRRINSVLGLAVA